MFTPQPPVSLTPGSVPIRAEGELVKATATCKTRWKVAWLRIGAIAVLALAACASHPPATAPRANGPYIAARPAAFEGHVVGDGHCVDFVKAAAGVPRTAVWREGPAVLGNPDIAPGTAIATFGSDGSYTSESGNHAAIYLYQDDRGLWVYDQWQGQPVHQRLIRFEGGSGGKWGNKSNDGTRFAVIE
jgi:hypothetical protein